MLTLRVEVNSMHISCFSCCTLLLFELPSCDFFRSEISNFNPFVASFSSSLCFLLRSYNKEKIQWISIMCFIQGHLFFLMIYFNILAILHATQRWIVGWQMEVLEGSSHDTGYKSCICLKRSSKTYIKKKTRIAGASAEIWTKHLLK
jgi:hypothetical protein